MNALKEAVRAINFSAGPAALPEEVLRLAAAGSCIRTLSVISSVSDPAGTFTSLNASRMYCRSCVSSTSAAERLTAISSGMWLRCQAASCARADCSTQRVSAAEVPVFSAIGMNSAGDTGPNSGCCQRTNASTPQMRRSRMRVLG